ncbi:MAG: hypothetical protein GWM98_23815 [Nitrospinaceae bacterium]|nr:hypothetical protein [Nitrospinaceae bacterium]NIR56927.1 hypothetical protein [Nitrospinaceae bacterium]NIS87389.1 hypothetical protein [Nitrospinaceae bacterium]NIT84241.1 hypothetical protein [Nitrospinaceae bacterium]NIU46429.1 hypothetical protein [Nitrospinaceae bacterium]
MKLTKKAIAGMALATMIFMGAQSGIAQPADNAYAAWDFHKKTRNSIQNVLEDNGAHSVGLSSGEQKAMDRHGIAVGDTFYTRLYNIPVMVKRNTTGVEVIKVDHDAAGHFNLAAPVQETYEAQVVDYRSEKPAPVKTVAWMFDHPLTEKIERHMEKGQKSAAVGLSTAEQKMLEANGIEVGHSFKSVINGNPCEFKRNSMGLSVKVMHQDLEASNPVNANASVDRV